MRTVTPLKRVMWTCHGHPPCTRARHESDSRMGRWPERNELPRGDRIRHFTFDAVLPRRFSRFNKNKRAGWLARTKRILFLARVTRARQMPYPVISALAPRSRRMSRVINVSLLYLIAGANYFLLEVSLAANFYYFPFVWSRIKQVARRRERGTVSCSMHNLQSALEFRVTSWYAVQRAQTNRGTKNAARALCSDTAKRESERDLRFIRDIYNWTCKWPTGIHHYPQQRSIGGVEGAISRLLVL